MGHNFQHYCWRSAGIGTGILKVVAATPIPFWHPFGGNVQAVWVPWQPAAQNISPSMPVVVPAPAGWTVSTKFAACDCCDWLNGPTQFGSGF